MTEHSEDQAPKQSRSVAQLTTDIVVACVARNTIAVAKLGDVIGAVGRALVAIGREEPEPPKADLTSGYPMAAPSYCRQRSEMAKRVGLGQRVQAAFRS